MTTRRTIDPLPNLTKQERAAVVGALRHYIARWADGTRRPVASYYAALRALAKITDKRIALRTFREPSPDDASA
jgi:hypothetical protein